MKTVRMTIDPAAPATWASGRMDPARVDATTEKSIALQHAADEAEAIAEKVSALKTESYFREHMARDRMRLSIFGSMPARPCLRMQEMSCRDAIGSQA